MTEKVTSLDRYRPHNLWEISCECGAWWMAAVQQSVKALHCPLCGYKEDFDEMTPKDDHDGDNTA